MKLAIYINGGGCNVGDGGGAKGAGMKHRSVGPATAVDHSTMRSSKNLYKNTDQEYDRSFGLARRRSEMLRS